MLSVDGLLCLVCEPRVVVTKPRPSEIAFVPPPLFAWRFPAMLWYSSDKIAASGEGWMGKGIQ